MIGIQHCIHFRCAAQGFDIYLYREMTAPISVVNIPHFTVTHFVLMMRMFKICSLSDFERYNTRLLISYHAVLYIPRSSLSYNWEFVPFDQLPPVPPPHTPPLANINLISASMTLGFFPFHISEIIQYLSLFV